MKKIIFTILCLLCFVFVSCDENDYYLPSDESNNQTTTSTPTTYDDTKTESEPTITNGGEYTETETGEWEYLG